MTTTPNDVVTNLQEAALTVLNDLVVHKIKGADMIIKGMEEMSHFAQNAATWYEELKALLVALQPFFGMVREWLSTAYTHLMYIYDWAKEQWHKIFG